MPTRLIKKVTGLFRNKSTSNTIATNEAPAPVVVSSPEPDSFPRVIKEEQHQIARKYLDDNAAKVVYRLLDGGHEAYLVGGCIRDLLLKKRPKDFDVATSAHPEEAHQLFKRSRLIGRRFKLLHVRFGRDLIEVATFRANHDSNDNENETLGKQSNSGLILRDNVYGTIEDDAVRRDFTINALYYSVADKSIYDFANGYDDIEKRTIRMIGEPDSRYREDPVRMLRAIRFSAKLNFTIEPATEAPIKPLANLLQDIAPARLFDETLKLLQSGHGEASFALLKEYNLLEQLLPLTQQAINDPTTGKQAETLIINALKNTDRRLSQRKSVTPAFLFAVLLWQPLQNRMQALLKETRMPAYTAMQTAANEIISEQVKRIAIPKRFSVPMREIWELQLKLPKRHGHRAQQTLEQPRFRAAYDLLLLREQSGEQTDNLGQWWTRYQSASEDEKSNMVAQIKPTRQPRHSSPKNAKSTSGENKPKPRRRSRAKNDPRNQQA
ncbi:polynucleotide adenylyltransferase PcnB [Neptunomonas phycophila]|uniref:polynucleotide adenylyltransferase PcnB n=1 Tax=Neptunomonas phycophila TaxID=1572645 RepID=UPI0026E312E5|nr:polynucleotide adenylyltransferase PcnB [Neptunomonas phycophila]MDO6784661.1 polynucleotide adenylyltransferase PcnB [Neptunomonas phycophila]